MSIELLEELLRFIGWMLMIKFVIDLMFMWAGMKLHEKMLKEEIREKLSHVKFANCTAEVINDTVFLYDEDHNFLAQGKTSEEIREHLKARFKQFHVNLSIDSESCPNWLKQDFSTENGK